MPRIAKTNNSISLKMPKLRLIHFSPKLNPSKHVPSPRSSRFVLYSRKRPRRARLPLKYSCSLNDSPPNGNDGVVRVRHESLKQEESWDYSVAVQRLRNIKRLVGAFKYKILQAFNVYCGALSAATPAATVISLQALKYVKSGTGTGCRSAS